MGIGNFIAGPCKGLKAGRYISVLFGFKWQPNVGLRPLPITIYEYQSATAVLLDYISYVHSSDMRTFSVFFIEHLEKLDIAIRNEWADFFVERSNWASTYVVIVV